MKGAKTFQLPITQWRLQIVKSVSTGKLLLPQIPRGYRFSKSTLKVTKLLSLHLIAILPLLTLPIDHRCSSAQQLSISVNCSDSDQTFTLSGRLYTSMRTSWSILSKSTRRETSSMDTTRLCPGEMLAVWIGWFFYLPTVFFCFWLLYLFFFYFNIDCTPNQVHI